MRMVKLSPQRVRELESLCVNRMVKRAVLTRSEAENGIALDRAAAGRREAQTRQERARFCCRECHGPDGRHTGKCGRGRARTRSAVEVEAILNLLPYRTAGDEAHYEVLRARLRSQTAQRALLIADGDKIGPVKTEAAFRLTLLELAEEKLERLNPGVVEHIQIR